ncbi:MAG: serine hydrolase domain-containing protein [Vulcanimicrobiaceae bacterium]
MSCLLVAIVSGAPSAVGEQQILLSSATQHAIESVVARDLATFGKPGSVPGAVIGVWIPGAGTFVKGVGYADLSSRLPMSPEDKFRIGSNTKTFVVTVLLQLVDEKRLSLNDPLSKFKLGVTIPNAGHITVRELCMMRSGLMEAYDTPQVAKMQITPNSNIAARTLIEYAVSQPALFAPGTRYNYSNTNYLLLGLIVESLTHHPIQQEIQRRILTPLRLSSTSFPVSDPAMPLPYSHGYELEDSGKWHDVTISLPPSLTWAAGVMISDMTDMRRWVKAYVTGTTNSSATQKARLTCLPTGGKGLSFGLGIGCSGGWFGYTGGLPGYNTAAYYLPEKGATIIAFVNAQRDRPSPGVANAIARDITKIITPANILFP